MSSYSTRRALYLQIEQLRQRPLIVYVTSPRPNAGGQMAFDVIPQLIRQIQAIPSKATTVDLLVISMGGDPVVAWHIVSMLRERFEHFAVLLPYTAYSAATLLALGADEIVMHPFSNLGPVDPQLTYSRPAKDGQGSFNIHFGAEDLLNYLSFVREDLGISDQRELMEAFKLVGADIGAIPVGVAKRSSQLTLSMGEKLLRLHMDDANKARTIAETLSKSFYHHGYPVSRREAERIGLPITKPDSALENALWQVREALAQYLHFDEPFSPLELILQNETAAKAITASIPQINLPPNIFHPQILPHLLTQLLQQIHFDYIPPVDYQIISAILESPRLLCKHITTGKVFATRLPDLRIRTQTVPINSKWLPCSPPAEDEL